MTDKITKILRKSSKASRIRLLKIFEEIATGNLEGLDMKQLSGKKDYFRVRCGDFRILLVKSESGFEVIDVRRRNDRTYRDL